MATENTYTPAEGQDNYYAADNTKDYTSQLEQQYNDSSDDYSAKIDTATDEAVSSYKEAEQQGLESFEKLGEQFKQDYQEAVDTREAIEANNGNRDGIGHSQYGQLEQALSDRMGTLKTAEEELKTQTIRAVADARAAGDYNKANALLQTAQAKLQAIYTEQKRIDTNLRSNYETQTEWDQEDKSIQAELDQTELEWKQEMGMNLLKYGIMPDDDILNVMGLSPEIAKQLAKYALTKLRGGSGGGGSSSSKKSTSSGTPETGDENAYNNILAMCKSGQTVAAKAAIAQSSTLNSSQKTSLTNYADAYDTYYAGQSANSIKNDSSANNTDWYKKYYG